jgi:hypothetical protein
MEAQLSDIINKVGLDESNWGNAEWKSLYEHITQDTLNDAFNTHNVLQKTFPELEMITRKCKSLKRVNKKMEEQNPYKINYFKVISDFIAVRIHCQVNQIKDKLDYITNIVNSYEGSKIYIRGSSIDQPSGKYNDITQYAYVYMQEIGYIVEFQIGHEFAAYTFTTDSEIRDNPNCGEIDLWTDGFYNDVKKYILQDNNDLITKNDILQKAEKIHNNIIPTDLLSILNRL